MSNTKNPDSLIGDIDFLGESGNQDSITSAGNYSDFFASQVKDTLIGTQRLEDVLVPDDTFLESLKASTLSPTTINTLSKSGDSTFPELFIDKPIPVSKLSEYVNKKGSREVENVNKDNTLHTSLQRLGLEEKKLQEFFFFLENDMKDSLYLGKKIASFFCGSTIKDPFSKEYDSESDLGFIGKDNLVEKINRYGLIILYFMYELGITPPNGKSQQWLANYVENNFIRKDFLSEKFSHILVNKSRKHFGKPNEKKVYIQLTPETREKFQDFFNFIGSYCFIKTQKILKKIEKGIKKETDEEMRKTILKKIDEASKAFTWDE